MPKAIPKPSDFLLSYQSEVASDNARFKYALMARQTGKDFSAAYEGIRDCQEWELKKSATRWTIAAPSERQSLESLDQWKIWMEIFKIATEDYIEEREGGPETLLKAATIVFPHGSRVMAVPGKPDTVRGPSSNMLLTEFNFFEQPDLTWRALYPIITNPLRGGEKKMRIVSTPNGIGNKGHDLWVKNYQVKGAQWSCHLVDIYKAVKQGLKVNIDEIRSGMDDPEGFAQEYECLFIDAQSVLLPYELIAPCESAEARVICPADYWSASSGSDRLYTGIDFGRRRDLTVAWTCKLVGDVLHTVEVLCLDKTPTPEQIEILRPRLRRASRVCFDYTGPGVGMGDFLKKEFGEYDPEKHQFGKIELCDFSNTLKVDIFSKLRMQFEKIKVRVPVDRTVREDLHSMSRVSTPGGKVTYKAPHTADGHADRCTALALCVRAGTSGSGPVQSSAIPMAAGSAGNLGMGRPSREVLL